MKWGLIALLVAPVVIVPVWYEVSAGQSTPEIMREKLDHAQQLLEAIALADFEAVEERASRLHYLSEVQSWFVLPTEEYDDHSKAFREAAEAVASAGKSRDLDAATEAYASMFTQCVQCHAYMRRVREAKKPF